MTRTPPPGLVIEAPLCSMCDRPTDATPDGLECSACDAWWSYANPEDVGNWGDPDAEQCTATTQPRTKVYRCLRHVGHPGEHYADGCQWSTAIEGGAAA